MCRARLALLQSRKTFKGTRREARRRTIYFQWNRTLIHQVNHQGQGSFPHIQHNFSIEELDPISHVKNAYIPAFFIHGKDDIFIVPKHSEELHAAYSGEKKIKIIEG